MNVLFVCTGNVCRSPMAEGFLKREAAERGLDIDVRSTGTHAWAGRAATIDGRRVMQEFATPIEDHRTLELTKGLVDWADLVVGLAAEHVREVKRDYPHAAGKTLTLGQLVRVLPALPDFTDSPSWVGAAVAAANGHPPADVDDPIGQREEAYRRVATEIRDLVATLADGMELKRLLRGTA